MQSDALIHISMGTGEIEISGSEAFVSQQIENFKEVIIQTLQTHRVSTPDKQINHTGEITQVENSNLSKETNPYPHLFANHEGKAVLLKTPTGNSKREKMVNISMLYLLAKSLFGQGEDASYPELRQLCKEHSCLDENNFSKAISESKEIFLVSGTVSTKTAKLTHPGKKQAEDLARQLNN
jgi:hypothetical protein